MFKINVIAVGKLKEKYFQDCEAEYKKRLSRFCELNIIELKDSAFTPTPSNDEIEKIKRLEAAEILKRVRGALCCCCIEGEAVSSEDISEYLAKTKALGGELTLVIGGSYGLDGGVKSKADKKISFSRCTFTHTMFRIMLLEQLYRGFMIDCGSSYHK